MQAEVRPIFELYSQANTAYVIPSYQRPFSWSNQKAIDLLDAVLEDVVANESITVLGTILICPVTIGSSHPFGENRPSSNAPQTMYEVVDGQQRMTTFALIGQALKQRLAELIEGGLNYQPTHEFESLYRAFRRRNGVEVPVLIRDGDNFDTGYKSELAIFLESFISNAQSPLSLGNRLFDMKNSIDDWVKKNLTAANFQNFSEYLLIKCNYVHVVADDQNTAFAMFEPLNSTSEPLTAFEVYRSKVTRMINPPPKFENVEGLLDYSHAQRDEVTTKSNNLVFSMAQAFDGQRPKRNFNRLKVYLDTKIDQSFVDYIESAADFYSRIWYELPEKTPPAIRDISDLQDAIRFLKASAHDAPVPLLIRYYIEKPEWMPTIAKIIVAFFALWRVGFETSSLPGVYRDLLNPRNPNCINIMSGNIKTPAELAAYFRGVLQDKWGRPQEREQYLDLWLRYQTQLSYENQKTICRFFILQHMKETLRVNFIPDDPWTKVDDIEHIASQNGALSSDLVNIIGNLTILPSSINRSMQNAPWDDKREIFGLLSSPNPSSQTTYKDGRPMPPQVVDYINSNAKSLSHLRDLSQNATWSQDEIMKRNKDLLSVVWDVLWGKWLNPG